MSESEAREAAIAMQKIVSTFDNMRRRIFRKAHYAKQNKLYGLSVRQSAAVSAVLHLTADRPEGITLKEFSKEMQVTPPAASIMVDSVVVKGYVERVPDEKDRRVVRIRISENGKKIVAEIQNLLFSGMEKLGSVLTAEERNQLLHIADKLSEGVSDCYRD